MSWAARVVQNRPEQEGVNAWEGEPSGAVRGLAGRGWGQRRRPGRLPPSLRVEAGGCGDSGEDPDIGKVRG